MTHQHPVSDPPPSDDPIFETIPAQTRSGIVDTLWWAVIGVGACVSAVALALVLVSCSGSLQVGDDDAVGDDDDAYMEFSVPIHGIFTIIATSANPWETGRYELEIW